jgi:hypothetical protein
VKIPLAAGALIFFAERAWCGRQQRNPGDATDAFHPGISIIPNSELPERKPPLETFAEGAGRCLVLGG